MYLKSIEVQGFKSFANKTLFEFHNGITCIVGPNGSGKSNVADAVRWVLGEQSSKQLRGANMQDVIFSGTQNRKPQGYASVAITFDNTDRHLNLDYNEVTVSRRIYRSGESEYRLNGTQCRLKDVTELFYDTGIGKEGYSIIGQGQIDKILSGKPEDRRELFDEAAGIVKFKRRKAEAKKKLDNEQANMVRLNDIMSELSRQVGPLEKQATAAKEYLKLRDELKQYDIDAYAVESSKTESDLAALEKNLAITTRDYNDTNRSSEALKAKYEHQQDSFNRLEEQITALRDESSACQTARQEKEGAVNVLKEQINTEYLRRTHTAERIETLEKEQEEYNAQVNDEQKKRQECSREIYDTTAKKDGAQSVLIQVQDGLATYQQALKDDQGKMISLLNEKSSFVGELQKYQTLLEQAKTEQAQMNRRLLESKTEESIWQKRASESEQSYKTISKQKAELFDKQREAAAALETEQKTREQLQNEYYEQRRLHQVSVTRAESLRNLAERYEGYGNSIRKIMEVRNQNPGIHGVVADLIHVEKRFETAVETALGGAIQNVVTDTEQTAKRLIAYLKQGRFGRATFLPLDAITVRDEFAQKDALKEPGVIGLASSLVKTEDTYKKLVQFLLGRIVVVDTIDHGLKVSAKFRRSLRIVTLEGELLNPGGSMTGGAFKNNSNLLGRNRELEELETKIKKETEQLKKLSARFEESEKKVTSLSQQVQKQQNEIQNLTLKETEGRLRMREASQRVEEIIKDREHLNNELVLQEGKLERIKASYEQVASSIKELESAGDESKDSADRNQSFVDEMIKKRDALTKEISDLGAKQLQLKQQEQFILENIRRMAQEVDKRKAEQDELQETLSECEKAVAEKTAQIDEVQKQIQSLEQTQKQKETELSQMSERRNRANESLKGFFAKREELSTRLSALDRDLLRMNNQKERFEDRLDELAEYLWEEYELRPSDAKAAAKSERPLSELREHINELKKNIRGLGNVNVSAIDEFKEVAERYTFMKTQYEDLIESEKTLQKVIEELDEGMRKQFKEKFEEIRVEFDRVFKELFGGGKGTLELVEDEDVIEAGIRIISQPPGKKLQNMMQLSGGEKALTAIALMFAIQNLKPSPFCLLDEIEAALDDSNVGRFANYLHKLTENTQFIVITHRRGTMTSADRLYGITMQEKGVSTLVSVNLIEKDLDK